MLHATNARVVRCPPSPHPPAPATRPASGKVGLQAMLGPVKVRRDSLATALARNVTRAWCGAHPLRTPRLQPRDPQDSQVGLKQRRAQIKTCVARKDARAWCGAHPPRTTRLQPRGPANSRTGPKTMPGPWSCRSAAHRPSRDPVSKSVHVPPAQVGTPCPRGPVTRGRLTANHTERGRLCTSTKTEPQNKQHTTNQQPHCPTTPEAWSVTATMRKRVPRDTAQRRDNLLFRRPVPL